MIYIKEIHTIILGQKITKLLKMYRCNERVTVETTHC